MHINDELNQLLENDSIQYPRLITAIMESIVITADDYLSIAENMDLTSEEVNNIFERAADFMEKKTAELS